MSEFILSLSYVLGFTTEQEQACLQSVEYELSELDLDVYRYGCLPPITSPTVNVEEFFPEITYDGDGYFYRRLISAKLFDISLFYYDTVTFTVDDFYLSKDTAGFKDYIYTIQEIFSKYRLMDLMAIVSAQDDIMRETNDGWRRISVREVKLKSLNGHLTSIFKQALKDEYVKDLIVFRVRG